MKVFMAVFPTVVQWLYPCWLSWWIMCSWFVLDSSVHSGLISPLLRPTCVQILTYTMRTYLKIIKSERERRATPQQWLIHTPQRLNLLTIIHHLLMHWQNTLSASFLCFHHLVSTQPSIHPTSLPSLNAFKRSSIQSNLHPFIQLLFSHHASAP